MSVYRTLPFLLTPKKNGNYSLHLDRSQHSKLLLKGKKKTRNGRKYRQKYAKILVKMEKKKKGSSNSFAEGIAKANDEIAKRVCEYQLQ